MVGDCEDEKEREAGREKEANLPVEFVRSTRV